jgi:hypothetical protein
MFYGDAAQRCPVSKTFNSSTYATVLLVAACGMCGSWAHAALGDNEASVQADGVHMKAQVRATATDGYAVHELTLPTGTRVREYVDSGGTVFAVSWQGPSGPDLKQLLGAYYETYVTAPRMRVARGAPVSVSTGKLVARTVSRMRMHIGMAYAPRLLPVGVDPESLR